MGEPWSTASEAADGTLRGFVGEEVWAELLAHATRRRHASGTVLLRQGEPGTHVLAVVSGVVKVVRQERNGDLTLLAFRGPGEVLGEMAVLDEGGRSASVEALSRCDVAVVSKAAFLRFVEDQGLFPVLVRYALTRLRESDQARGSGDLPDRLAAALVRLADISGRSVVDEERPLVLALTRDELAQHLGVTRNTVTATLGELAGHLRVSRKRIVIERLAALRNRAFPPDPG